MGTFVKSQVDQMNSLLRGELSATETYQKVLDKFPQSLNRPVLQDCASSHERRARLLAEAVRAAGGTPAESSGVWGTLAKLVQAGADVLGEKAAISALEEGEDHGRDDYRRDLDKLDPVTRQFIEERVIPEQLRTHQVISALKRSAS